MPNGNLEVITNLPDNKEKEIWSWFFNQSRSSSSNSLVMMPLYFNLKIKV